MFRSLLFKFGISVWCISLIACSTTEPPRDHRIERPPTGIRALGSPRYVKLKPVKERPGFYTAGERLMDMRGFRPGTEVRDPYSGELYLVPEGD